MDAVHAPVARLVVGGRRASFAEGDRHRPGLSPDLAVTLITGALAQVIQMRHRDGGETLVADIAKDAIGPLYGVA